ncbi:MAG: excinuclease ABC subunit UvrA [Candidatus Falkowbacteria bacterium]
MKDEVIKIRGARVNNLKNIDIDIPRHKFVVITGLSGSGKSSLAFDTLYAEGQRRYVESLSAYARQFVGLMDKPDVDMIEGLPPAISIDQRSNMHNPRSTVGTITETYDYFRLIFAKLGTAHCPTCNKKLKKDKKKLICVDCNFSMPEIRPNDFSFNSAGGACPACSGLGTKLEIDPELIINKNLTVAQGAIKPWTHYNSHNQKLLFDDVNKMSLRHNFNIDLPIKELPEKIVKLILNGDGEFAGVIDNLEKRYAESDTGYIHQKIAQYMLSVECSTCHGYRLKPEILAVKLHNRSINELSEMHIVAARDFFIDFEKNKKLTEKEKNVSEPIIKEIKNRLGCIKDVGLDYLSLNRGANTLSGGEAQRLKLATQINSALVGILYVLDEPSIGLHQKDNDKLIIALKDLQAKGNTVVVVEHDEATILAADYVIDIGPGAGEYGGNVVFAGTPDEIKNDPKSLTGAYLSGRQTISAPFEYRKGNGKSIKIIGATEHNLKNIDVEIPLGKLVAITGVSGSGKSTLMTDILANALNRKFYRAKTHPGKHKDITGLENIDKVIDIDQSPIGRTPRSNPATYTEVFTPIRDLYASQSGSKVKGFKANHFSFNTAGGRCDTCAGDGLLKIEMQFLSDIYVKCETCHGKRYKKEVLEINYKDKNIHDVLEMTVLEAITFFKEEKNILPKLKILNDVGLGYIKLGQSSTTLSGGEAQRIKLATELSRQSTGQTLYILDEPTTGLHFDDIKKLLKVLNQLTDKGNTVLVIEHNLDIIKSVDWIIDLGPDGGDKGGTIVGADTPKNIAKIKNSWTGKYLKDYLN